MIILLSHLIWTLARMFWPFWKIKFGKNPPKFKRKRNYWRLLIKLFMTLIFRIWFKNASIQSQIDSLLWFRPKINTLDIYFINEKKHFFFLNFFNHYIYKNFIIINVYNLNFIYKLAKGLSNIIKKNHQNRNHIKNFFPWCIFRGIYCIIIN